VHSDVIVCPLSGPARYRQAWLLAKVSPSSESSPARLLKSYGEQGKGEEYREEVSPVEGEEIASGSRPLQ